MAGTENTEQFVMLWEFDDDRTRDMALAMLKDRQIPAYTKDRGAGSYVRIFTGGSVFGSKLYVPVAMRSAAMETILPLVEPNRETELDESEIDYERDADLTEAETETGRRGANFFLVWVGLFVLLLLGAWVISLIYG